MLQVWLDPQRSLGMRELRSKIYLLCYSAMLKILTYYALNYAADSQLITSSTVVSIAPQGYIITNITCIIHCTCIPRQPASLLQDDNAF